MQAIISYFHQIIISFKLKLLIYSVNYQKKKYIYSVNIILNFNPSKVGKGRQSNAPLFDLQLKLPSAPVLLRLR